jgi:hypothetical protein
MIANVATSFLGLGDGYGEETTVAGVAKAFGALVGDISVDTVRV